MRLKELFNFLVKQGIANDPRGAEQISKQLKRVKKEYKALPEKEKKYFDKDKLENPYADTRILYGEKEREIKRILVGVDIDGSEVLLADRLGQNGQTVDLIISHHPGGRALAKFYEVMHMQEDILHDLGVPINVAEGILKERIKEVERRVMPANYNRAVDIARILDIPFICVHTPADNSVNNYLQKLMNEKEPYLVGDVLDLVMEIPEYQHAASNNNAPNIIVGNKSNRAGKVFVDMTGGTGGSKEAFCYLTQNTQIGTILGMHIGEDHRKQAEKNHVNVVIAGHMSSDSLGINLILDSLIKEEPLEIIACSGFKRVTRGQ